jgi:hypothetical protein
MQDDFRARCKTGKIDDHIRTLRRCRAEGIEWQRPIDQAAIGSDQVEGNHLPGGSRIFQSQVIDPGR